MSRAPLTVRLNVAENSLARYHRVAAGDKPGEWVTVREGRGSVLCCLTCLYDRRCPHIRAVLSATAQAKAA